MLHVPLYHENKHICRMCSEQTGCENDGKQYLSKPGEENGASLPVTLSFPHSPVLVEGGLQTLQDFFDICHQPDNVSLQKLPHKLLETLSQWE